MVRSGIVIIVAAFLVILYVSAFDWQPVRVPLNLATRNAATVTFTANSDDAFDVGVDLQRRLPFDVLEAVVGALLSRHPAKFHGLSLPTVRCSVEEAGHHVTLGNYTGGSWGDTARAIVATFAAHKGHTYTVTLEIQPGSAQIQAADPRLVVRVRRDPVAFGLNNLQVAIALAVYAAMFGAILLAIGLWRSRSVKRNTEQSA